jgi:hypothetical protein
MQVRERPPVDHSLNLSRPPDERDEGWGIAVEPDGEVHQGVARWPAAEGSMPFPRSRHVDQPPPLDE